MNEGILSEKSLDFAVRIVKLHNVLRDQRRERTMSQQILRAGTSIGANIAEGEFAQSGADFINKYAIARKESNETKYWLRLLHRTSYINDSEYKSLYRDVIEIQKMLTSSILTMEKKKK